MAACLVDPENVSSLKLSEPFAIYELTQHSFHLNFGAGEYEKPEDAFIHEYLQYIDLNDTHGKEIYEGAILHRVHHDTTQKTLDGHIGHVFRGKSGWCIRWSPRTMASHPGLHNWSSLELFWREEEWEIIGHMYDNPAVMEQHE